MPSAHVDPRDDRPGAERTTGLDEFGYLVDRIVEAPVTEAPFRHLLIDGLFSPAHFDRIVSNPQVHVRAARTDLGLLRSLRRQGYVVQSFPGCTTSVAQYLWRRRRGWPEGPLVEGLGLTMRLSTIRDPWFASLLGFLNGPELVAAIEARLGIPTGGRVETAVQKYLDGYEISPHPDIRRKLATYMVNINDPRHDYPAELNTHLLRFVPDRAWLSRFWVEHEHIDRCWVPWDWCETVTLTSANNSMVAFAPSDDTLHAVKLDYDHRRFQRTQIYGNLWRREEDRLATVPLRALESEEAARAAVAELA